jgi:predicted transglutaminase-like cysteine proteinase
LSISNKPALIQGGFDPAMKTWPEDRTRCKLRLLAAAAATFALVLAAAPELSQANVAPDRPVAAIALQPAALAAFRPMPLFVKLGGIPADPGAIGWGLAKRDPDQGEAGHDRAAIQPPDMAPPGVDQPETGVRQAMPSFVSAGHAFPGAAHGEARSRAERGAGGPSGSGQPEGRKDEASQPGAAQGAPIAEGLFGSAAIRTSRTVHAAAWSRVMGDSLGDALGGRCKGKDALCRSKLLKQARQLLAEIAALPLDEKVGRVNRFVNRSIRFEQDIDGYGVADHWATASETLLRGRGDCEDIALLKMALLEAAGLPAGDLLLVLGREPALLRDHAVLVVRRSVGAALVLDNLTDALQPAADPRRFLPMLSFSTAGAWLHGRRMAAR